jgi:hypothetical protein
MTGMTPLLQPVLAVNNQYIDRSVNRVGFSHSRIPKRRHDRHAAALQGGLQGAPWCRRICEPAAKTQARPHKIAGRGFRCSYLSQGDTPIDESRLPIVGMKLHFRHFPLARRTWWD